MKRRRQILRISREEALIPEWKRRINMQTYVLIPGLGPVARQKTTNSHYGGDLFSKIPSVILEILS